MAVFSVARAAEALLRARQARSPIPVEAVAPPDVEGAFDVQDAVAARLGRTGGWKVGAPGPDAPRTRAPLAAELIRPSPCRWPASGLIRIGIEVEVAFRIGRPIATAGLDREAIRAAIGSVHAAIEIVDSRYDTWPVPSPLAALADNQNNGGLVFDPAGTPPGDDDLSAAEVSLTVDGAAIFSGEGRNPGGSPFGLLAWLASHLAGKDMRLAAGDLVTTGSLTGLAFVEPGAEVVAEIPGLGRVEVAFPA